VKELGGSRSDKVALAHIGHLTGLEVLVTHWSTDGKMSEHWILVS